MSRPARSARPASRAGFTLIELVVASSIAAIVLGATASLIVVSSRALPDVRSPAWCQAEAWRAAAQLDDELREAVAVGAASSTSITFMIPDRDDDGKNEIITYAWNGKPGSALTRQMNSDPVENVCENVSSLSLTYSKASVSIPEDGPNADGAEQLLYSYIGSSPSERTVRTSRSCALVFQPFLAADAASWRMTRAEVYLRQKLPASGQLVTSVYKATSAWAPPTVGAALASASTPEASLPATYAWYSINLPTGAISPADVVCITFTSVSITDVAGISVDVSRAPMTSAVYSYNDLVSWQVVPDGSPYIRVYGVENRPSTSTTTQARLRGYRIDIAVGSGRAVLDGAPVNDPELGASLDPETVEDAQQSGGLIKGIIDVVDDLLPI